MSEWKAAARQWLAEDPDPNTRDELRGLLNANDEAQLADRFDGRLEFGTAGLRAKLGAGPNRMNRVVVLRTTAGLAEYLREVTPDCTHRGVVVGYDGRRMSKEFARDAVAVLAGAGIPAHVFTELAPTPLVAFAVQHLNAAAGIMVTASHNPAEYNGFKVYWGNGAQIIPPHDKAIATSIASIGPLVSIAQLPEFVARNRRLLHSIPEAVTEKYLEGVRGLAIHPDGPTELNVVYTALHGVGNKLCLKALSRFATVTTVAAQSEPDGSFPTVRFPNPEEPGALDLALALANEKNADIVLANDPDADRLAVAVRHQGAWKQLSGNEVGILLGHYILTEGPAGASGERLVASTIVSSPLLAQMARTLNVRYEETLTGFKWIANRALEIERSTSARFVFGYEEALGYTAGTLVRDKDGISAAFLVAELAAKLKVKGLTLVDQLEVIYRRFGLWVSTQHSITLPGSEGMRRIADTMGAFRRKPPRTMGGRRVHAMRDYQRGVRVDANDKTEKLTLPSSDVLQFELGGGSRVMLRPSGTEPKLKYYFDVCEILDQNESFEAGCGRANEKLKELVDDVLAAAAAQT